MEEQDLLKDQLVVAVGNDNNTNFATTVPEDIIKKTANQAVSNFARNKIMNTLGLAKFSNPIGIAMALKRFI